MNALKITVGSREYELRLTLRTFYQMEEKGFDITKGDFGIRMLCELLLIATQSQRDGISDDAFLEMIDLHTLKAMIPQIKEGLNDAFL